VELGLVTDVLLLTENQSDWSFGFENSASDFVSFLHEIRRSCQINFNEQHCVKERFGGKYG
tara:strand:- start:586 stop:768 length:183 start_codon:yes stop_codon:yes gene_type:complete